MAKNLYLETTGATGPIPNAVAVLGSTPDAADIALRKVLQFRDCPGPAIVIDYTGRGAMILSRANEGGLPKRRVLWYDLADRRCPTALFQLSHSDHFRQVMTRVLLTIKEISRTSITERTLTWAAEAAYNLSKSGTVGLGALLKSFSSRQI